jgi:hypothetical protein
MVKKRKTPDETEGLAGRWQSFFGLLFDKLHVFMDDRGHILRRRCLQDAFGHFPGLVGMAVFVERSQRGTESVGVILDPDRRNAGTLKFLSFFVFHHILCGLKGM